MKNKGYAHIIGFVAIAIILALFYLFVFDRGVGILFSCDSKEIISVRKVPPPLAAMMQPKICDVNFSVESKEGDFICQNFGSIYSSEKGILSCEGLDNFKGESVRVEATFFDSSGLEVGVDVKENLLVNP